MEIAYAPRPEYGLVVPLLAAVDGGVTARGGAEWLVLTAPLTLDVDRGTADGRLSLTAGETVHLALHRSTLEETPARVWSEYELAAIVDAHGRRWRSWSELHQAYDGPWRDLVHHSGRVLQGLSFQPSGAIVAAATTSLPEGVGGERNWDYRYSWVRDASFTMEALWVAACPDEAERLLRVHDHRRGLLDRAGHAACRSCSASAASTTSPSASSPTCRAGGTAGRCGSATAPGTSARSTCTASCSARPRSCPTSLARSTTTPASSLSPAPTRPPPTGREKDQGIWEVRGDPQHFLYSKVMCWVALDRAIALADLLQALGPGRALEAARARRSAETVARDGVERGGRRVHPVRRLDALDASNLMMPIVGFLPADDPRMLATIDAIEERLTDDRGLVYRYRTEEGVDGLAGEEGTFLLCTFWLAQALALADQVDRARAVFERAAGLRQRRRPAGRGGRPDDRRAARQLPAGLQPHRPGQRRLGDLRGRAAGAVLIMSPLGSPVSRLPVLGPATLPTPPWSTGCAPATPMPSPRSYGRGPR